MKIFWWLSVSFCLLYSPMVGEAVAAKPCDDVQTVAEKAMKERNKTVKEIQDATIPDPEDTREGISACLASINKLGNPFSMGITLPSMDEIMSAICDKVDSMIQSKINTAYGMVENSLDGLGGSNLFTVTGNGVDQANGILRHIK